MRHAVLGTGIVGRTIATKLLSLGHEVAMGTRDPRSTLARPAAEGEPAFAAWAAGHPLLRVTGFAEAAASAPLLVNATGGAVSLDVLDSVGERHLDGKVLIDVANPLDLSHGAPPTLDPVNTDSLGERIQRAFPGVRVVKTLNTMNCAVMVDPARVPGEHNVFLSGDDADAKTTAIGLLTSFGWPTSAIIDLGDISSSRGVEMLLPLWLRLWGALGHADFNLQVRTAAANA